MLSADTVAIGPPVVSSCSLSTDVRKEKSISNYGQLKIGC